MGVATLAVRLPDLEQGIRDHRARAVIHVALQAQPLAGRVSGGEHRACESAFSRREALMKKWPQSLGRRLPVTPCIRTLTQARAHEPSKGVSVRPRNTMSKR